MEKRPREEERGLGRHAFLWCLHNTEPQEVERTCEPGIALDAVNKTKSDESNAATLEQQVSESW